MACRNNKKTEDVFYVQEEKIINEIYGVCEPKVQEITRLKQEALSKMKRTKNKKKNDKILDEFLKEYEVKREEIVNILAPYLYDMIYSVVGDDQIDRLFDDNELKVGYFPGKHISFGFKEDYLYKIFKGYISDDKLLYCKIEDLKFFGICRSDIGCEEGFRKLLFYESEFVLKFYRSNRYDEIKQNYQYDINCLVLSALNGLGGISEMEFYVKEYPKSSATKIIKIFLNHYYKDGNNNMLDEKYEKLIEEELRRQTDELYFLFE